MKNWKTVDIELIGPATLEAKYSYDEAMVMNGVEPIAQAFIVGAGSILWTDEHPRTEMKPGELKPGVKWPI